MPLAQQIGGIVIGGAPQSTLAAAATCAASTVCSLPTGTASITASGGQAPYTYQWDGPNGFSAGTPVISDLYPGNYRVTVTDLAGNSVVAEILVADSENTLGVNVIQTSNALCGQAVGCASLEITGGATPYTFAWSTGGSAASLNCALPPGEHSVTVTDAHGCTSVSPVLIGNQDEIDFLIATDFIECNGAGSISVDINNNLPFQYLWSTGDTTQSVSGLEAGLYTVTITLAGGCSSVENAMMFNLTEFNWGINTVAICSSNTPHTGAMRLHFNPTGTLTFPATVSWSDGSIHTIEEKPAGSLLDSLTNIPEGLYLVTVTDSEGCSVTIEGRVDCSTMPPLPDSLPAFYIKDENGPLDSCTGVYARYFNNIGALAFSLNWSGAEIRELRQLNLPGMSQNDFTYGSQGRSLGIQWQSPAPVSLPQESLLFEVCFEPVEGEYQIPNVIDFGDSPVDVQLIDGQHKPLAFIGREGYVLFDAFNPDPPSICAFGVVPPDCAADGNSQAILEPCTPGLPLDVFVSSADGNDYLGGIGSLLSLPAGKYITYAYQETSGLDKFFVQIPESDESGECVWPGDADDNNAANQYDLLYIGLAYGAQGEVRTNGDQEWRGQDAADWLQVTTERQVNFKNIDGNGDGVINAADTLCISQNWSRVINPSLDNPFAMPGIGGAGQAHIRIDADTLEAGQTALLPLIIGSSDLPMDNVYGLAFSIVYDPGLIKDNVRFIPGDSWLGNAGNYLYMQKNFPDQGHLDVAITRTDGVPVSGWGSIGALFIIIEDNIFEPPSGPASIKTPVYINGLCTINSIETTSWNAGTPNELVIRRSSSPVIEATSPDPELWIFPNPAATTVRFASRAGVIQNVMLSDLSGKVFVNIAGDQKDLEVSISQLPVGMYLARILTNDGLIIRKLSISR